MNNTHCPASLRASICTWNAQGLNCASKRSSLQLFLDRQCPLAVAIQDHRLTSPVQQLRHPNYVVLDAGLHLLTLVRTNVLHYHLDGGLRPAVEPVFYDQQLTMQWIELRLSAQHSIALANVYRWPNVSLPVNSKPVEALQQSITQAHETIIQSSRSSNISTILLGDFNLPHGPWGRPTSTANECIQSQIMSDALNDFDIECLNSRMPGIATRRSAGSSSTLDLVWCSTQTVSHITIDDELTFGLASDHLPVAAHINHSMLNQSHVGLHSTNSHVLPNPWRCKTADWDAYQTALDVHLHHACCMSMHVDESNSQHLIRDLDALHNAVTHCIIAAAHETVGKQPNRKVFRTSDAWCHFPGMEEAIDEKQRTERRLSRKRGLQSTTQQQIEQLQHDVHQARQRYDAIKRQAQQASWEDVIQGINDCPHDPWTVTARLTRKAASASTGTTQQRVRSKTGAMPSSTQQSLCNLNAHFADTFARNDISRHDDFSMALERFASNSTQASPAYRPQATVDTLPLNAEFSLQDIVDVCSSVHVQTSSGPDDVSPYFLKHASTLLHQALHRVFSISWRTGVVPSALKQANVCALFKSGDKADPNSYRPISITSILARRYECLVKHRLIAHLDAHQFVSPTQAGFRKGRSTADCLFQVTEAMHSTLRHHTRRLPFMFIDISKAFDSVFKEGLLFKLWSSARVRGNSWHWINSFLSNRQVRSFDCASREHSSWTTINNGVPQGSVLAPLLFLVFINDLGQGLTREAKVSSCLFADDIVIWPCKTDHLQTSSAPRITTATQRVTAALYSRRDNADSANQMQRACTLLSSWAYRWRVVFSCSKTQIMMVSRTKPAKLPEFCLTGSIINYCLSYKYLGLHLHSRGNWTTQFRAVKKKMAFAAHNIGKLCCSKFGITLPIARRLCTAIVQAQLAYALPFWQPTATHYKQFDAILCRPIRRALKLPRCAGAQTLLIESHMLPARQLRSKLNFNWSSTCSFKPDAQSGLSKQLLHTAHSHAVSNSNSHMHSPMLSTLLVNEQLLGRRHYSWSHCGLLDLQIEFRRLLWQQVIQEWMSQPRDFPLSGLRRYWAVSSPACLPPHYKLDTSIDAACRARWRCDLSFGNDALMSQRRGINPSCASCPPDEFGLPPREDRPHMLLHCRRFASQRRQLLTALLSSFHVSLSDSLLMGDCSLPWKDKGALQSILRLTGQFLRFVHSQVDRSI
jgi:hypothetical protein